MGLLFLGFRISMAGCSGSGGGFGLGTEDEILLTPVVGIPIPCVFEPNPKTEKKGPNDPLIL
jgi:hypothetical protein